MSVTWSTNKITENQGINHVTQVVNNCGCIAHKIDGSNDIGIDSFIEFIDKGVARGFCIAAQIKSGDSNLSSDHSKVFLKSDKDHFDYWQSHVLEVAGIVYIPSENQAYWVNIKKYLEDNPAIMEQGPYQIPINKTNVFSVENFQAFNNHFKAYSARNNKIDEDSHFGRTLKLFAEDDPRQRFEAIKSLFYYHRNHNATWFYLLNQLGSEGNHFIQFHLILIFIHLVPVGDIWLHAGNIINSDIEKYAKGIIKKNYGLKEIKILLSHLDDNGFTRGSLGRHFPALIDLIPNWIKYLKMIILDKETNSQIRFFAAIAIIYNLQFYDLERAINFSQSMISNFPDDSEACERFQGIKETLEDGNSFQIY